MKKFRKIYVEITNICNLKCSFCPDTTRKKEFMSLKKFEEVAGKISDYTDYVYLHVKGEPLLHPKLKEILDICKKYKLKVNISTNGVLLKNNKDILRDIRQLNVSLHSFEKDDEEKLEEYILEVLDACDELSKSGVIIRLKMWNDTDINKKTNKKILDILENRYKKKIDSSVKKDIKLHEKIFLSIKQPFVWPSLDGKDNENGSCYGLRKQIAILVDGTVTPCCVDNNGDINLGNIFKEELKDILNKELSVNIKQGFERGICVSKLCKKCAYRSINL